MRGRGGGEDGTVDEGIARGEKKKKIVNLKYVLSEGSLKHSSVKTSTGNYHNFRQDALRKKATGNGKTSQGFPYKHAS